MDTDQETLGHITTTVLDGSMQDRYFEHPTLHFQFHPNYVNPNTLASGSNYVSEAPWDTRTAIRGAFLLRWIGLNQKPVDALDESKVVPDLFDMSGESVSYSTLQPAKTLRLLEATELVTYSGGNMAATSRVRKVLLRNPNQTATILPARSRLFHGFRRGMRAHRLYNEIMFGDPDATQHSKTSGTSSVEKRRSTMRIIRDPDR